MRSMARRIRFGPAGWDYPDWAGIVYPKPKPKNFDPLRFVSAYFDTVEINSTFYRPAAPKTAKQWAERVRDQREFRFALKLYKRFTHERSTAFTREEVDEVRSGISPLAEAGRLGAVLLQFPWSFRNDDANREWLRDVTRAFREYPLVVEVRHASWNEPGFYAELLERGLGIVNIDQPLFHDSIRPSARATSAIGYVRVHGRNYRDWFRKTAGRDERYDYLYTAKELEPWAERTRELAKDPLVHDVYVVNNNHFRGQAVANAAMLQSQVEGERVRVPETLFETYRKVLEPFARPDSVSPELPLGR
jgi:uncharacterized protein YecE (DUF72 family)